MLGSDLVASAIAGSVPIHKVGARQRACGQPECRRAPAPQDAGAWRARNPDYFAARRIQARAALARAPEPLRLPPPLGKLPWDIAQSEFGVQGADFIGVMGALLLHSAQSQLMAYPADSKTDAAHYSLRPRNPRCDLVQSGAPVEGSGRCGVEFHQLDRRWEHLRVRRPERQRRLLASLASRAADADCRGGGRRAG